MRKQKKYVIGAVILSVVVAVGIGVTMACGPKGPSGAGFYPGPHSEDVADFIMWKMDRGVKTLNLNEAQTREYEKVKEGIKAGIADALAKRREFRGIVRDELDRENPDVNALAGLIKERVNRIPEMVSKKIDLFVNFYNTLDKDQKARAIEMLRSRVDSAQKRLD
jgi:hypothetical protein